MARLFAVDLGEQQLAAQRVALGATLEQLVGVSEQGLSAQFASSAPRTDDVVMVPARLGLAKIRTIVADVAPALVLVSASREQAALAANLVVQTGAHDVWLLDGSSSETQLRWRRATGAPQAEVRRPRKSDVIVGSGAWHKALFDQIAMVASSDATVTILGESGTGKELVARTIHTSSARRAAPFVVVNCAAMPASLLEDELFGHVRGAFTDAMRDREGLIAAAEGGTLFLDEIGEMPLELQGRLLRVIQNHEIRRLGDDKARIVDVRILTATNRNLERACAEGVFRQDLYYRIAVLSLHLPSLRERADDIPLLVHHFMQRLAPKLGREYQGVTAEALLALKAYGFPGNVRELENKLHHAMVVAKGPWIELTDFALPDAIVPAPRASLPDITRPFRDVKRELLDEVERSYFARLIEACDGNLTEVARRADIDRKNLWQYLRKHGLR